MKRLVACPYCGVSGPRLNPELCGSCGRKGLLELKKYSPVKRPAVRWQFQAATAVTATVPAAFAVFVLLTLLTKLVDAPVDTRREQCNAPKAALEIHDSVMTLTVIGTSKVLQREEGARQALGPVDNFTNLPARGTLP